MGKKTNFRKFQIEKMKNRQVIQETLILGLFQMSKFLQGVYEHVHEGRKLTRNSKPFVVKKRPGPTKCGPGPQVWSG